MALFALMLTLSHTSTLIKWCSVLKEKSLTHRFGRGWWSSMRIHLNFFEELINGLFVASVVGSEDGNNKAALLATQVLRAADRFATVNDYPLNFDPQKPPPLFKYLIPVGIQKGSPAVYITFEDILLEIGKVIDKKLAPGSAHHGISALLVV
ncbi:unnamed protein product [Calypogeia fissa]